MSKLDMDREFIPVNFAILTISDTRSLGDDKSGDFLSERIQSSGHFVKAREITTDDEEKIVSHLEKLVERIDVDVIISTGGTGLTGRDVTVEAHKKIYEKEICISPLKSLSLHLTNVNSSYGLSPFIDYKKLWNENEL